MSSTRVDLSPAVATRKRDISSWVEGDVTRLSTREKKRYNKWKNAIRDYFTSDESLEALALRYHLSPKSLESRAARCLMQHEEGKPWGYRALLPGARVVDHAPGASLSTSTQTLSPVSTSEKVQNNETHGYDDARSSSTEIKPATIADEASATTEMDQVDENEVTAKRQALRLDTLADLPKTPLPVEIPADEDEKPATESSSASHPSSTQVEDSENVEASGEEVPAGSMETTETGSEASISEVPQVESEEEPSSSFPTSEDREDSAEEETPESRDDSADKPPAEHEAFFSTVNEQNELVTEAETASAGTDEQDESPTELETTCASENEQAEPVVEPESVSIDVNEQGEPATESETAHASIDEQGGPSVEPEAVSIDVNEQAELLAEPEAVAQEETQTLTAGEQQGEENAAPAPEEADSSGMALPLLQDAPETLEVSEPAVPVQSPDHPVEVPTAVQAPGAPIEVPGAAMQADGHSKQLPAVNPVNTVALAPFYATGKYRTVGKKGSVHHSIRKRRVKVEEHRKKRSLVRMISAIVLAVMLVSALIPVGVGVAAYSAYTNIKGVATDGVNHLLAVKSLLPASKSDFTSALDAHKLQQAQLDLTKAQGDFLELQGMVNRPDVQSAIRQFAPEYGKDLGMAQHLVQVALDVSRMGDELAGVALLGANIIHGSPLASGSTKPLVTMADITNIEGALVHAQYYINDISTQMNQVSLASIPISASQKTQLSNILGYLPKAQDTITQVQGLVGVVSWLLGVDHQRRFLVQTMDRAELRPGGGFTGQFGILQIQNGRLDHFDLQDVTELDYAGNGFELGRQPPPQYSWMNLGNWGLRDANLSADYPTNAHLVMQVFQQEGGGTLDGSISFTPVLISQVLQVTGPIHVAGYNETITAQNLEDKLHYYQQDYNAIRLQQQKTGTAKSDTRKAFTRLLGQLLMDRVKHMQVKQLMQLLPFITKDIQSRDLGIYFNNPVAEGWLVQHGYSGAFTNFSQKDGFAVVQSNISVSKASQYVHTTEQDQVVLDAQGGATHNLTITLDYNQTGPVYGFDTYVDYIRVYAPANAQFLSGDGFDTHKPLCTPSPTNPPGKPSPGTGTGTTPPPNTCSGYFPTNARYCSNGNYSLGQGFVYGKGYTNLPVDALGAPTETSSDLPGYSMWGGMTETPKNCTSYITLSWYVPHVVNNKPGQSPYSIIVDKQGGYVPTIDISVDTSALPGIKPYSFKGDMIADKVLALPLRKK